MSIYSDNSESIYGISEYHRELIQVFQPFEVFARAHQLIMNYYVGHAKHPSLRFENENLKCSVNLTTKFFSIQTKLLDQKYMDIVGELKVLINNSQQLSPYPFEHIG